ncbi:CopG family transcriptional regulator [Macrococcus brunensis]|uniref:CopG family transcriptional regulator n=1 Tax=Macrococcus brunensis TaxID=198483 RepID=A0A4R6BAL7_9STAP|nr:CopG family transcriptional regulator [Macrococcus brunensis]TDL93348.1 CopG family transcriptional regulator [Macrococcus brunensis]
MAFEYNSEKSNKIKKALKSNSSDESNKKETHSSPNIEIKTIEVQPPHEIKQRYNIMLDPSVKQKADKIAKDKNFKSTSAFLNELIKSL